MTAEVELFEVGQPVRYLPESVIINMLIRRYGEVRAGAQRYSVAAHVANNAPWPAPLRVCDFMALDCWKGRDGYALHGFEIKASRADWLTELRDPTKADAFKQYCDRWWLVVSDERIVRPGELPTGWGLLAAVKEQQLGLALIRPARKLQPEPWPRPLVASFARAVAKSARAGAL